MCHRVSTSVDPCRHEPQPDLSADEIRALIDRCPPELRWAFGGWLNGTHCLNGDLIECEADK